MHLGPPTPPSNVRIILRQAGGIVTAGERRAGQPVVLAPLDPHTFEGQVADLPPRGWLTVVVDGRFRLSRATAMLMSTR